MRLELRVLRLGFFQDGAPVRFGLTNKPAQGKGYTARRIIADNTRARVQCLAWEQAKVTGTATGDTISVKSVTAAK